MPRPELTAGDLERLESREIGPDEAHRQLELLRDPPEPFRLLRPCTIGDGIAVLDEERVAALEDRYRTAADSGRAMKMVPASGAATRMFRTLTAVAEEDPPPTADELESRAASGDRTAADALRLLDEIDRFPFADDVRRLLATRGRDLDGVRHRREVARLLEVVVTDDGLGLASRPKALIPFHSTPEGSRTPLEEHMVEGSRYCADRDRRCRLHFTVAPEFREAFSVAVREAGSRHQEVVWEVAFSVQDPSTDTLAVTPEGEPFRRDDGELLLRPGGHGALLANLEGTGGDVVFVKNIDNVLPEEGQGLVADWQQGLGGLLIELQDRLFDLFRRLDEGEPEAAEGAAALLEDELHDPGARELLDLSVDERLATLRSRLHRPLRVCGVVENEGEPGGGPFWVEDPGGRRSVQIVEGAQVPDDPGQREIFAASTHFNPVQIVCGLRDHRGEPYPLGEFADERAVFVAEKTHEGRPLLAMERPGLWNGGMAGWHTVFVEVPSATFAPVKTVFDLLREAHLSRGR